MQDRAYFNRKSRVLDGRAFGERTRQAVLRTASNVETYRGLAEALSQAVDGTLITISQKIVVPETLLIKGNKITITCIGEGGLVPSGEDYFLFDVLDVDDVFLDRVMVFESKDNKTFQGFVRFTYNPTSGQFRKNIYIKDCLVFSQVFLEGLSGAGFPKELTVLDYDNWTGNRTFIQGNVHKSLRSDASTEAAFLTGNGMFMATYANNESNGYMYVVGAGNIIIGNAIFGQIGVGPGSSILVDASSFSNIISSNLVRLATIFPFPGNTVSGELAL